MLLSSCHTCIASERILKQTSELRVSVRHVGDCRSLLVVPKSADNVPKRKQPAIDMDALLEAVSLSARALDAFTASEVDEVELGRDVITDSRVGNKRNTGGWCCSWGGWRWKGSVFRDGFDCGRCCAGGSGC